MPCRRRLPRLCSRARSIPAPARCRRSGASAHGPPAGVKTLTTILLLRLRHKLTVHARRERLLLAEEAGALAFEANAAEPKLVGEAALASARASGRRRSRRGRARPAARAGPRAGRGHVLGCHRDPCAGSGRRACHDHARVRAALPGVSRVSVEPVLPVDVIGIYVLVPAGI